MQPTNSSIGKYFVQVFGIIGLVVVVLIDAQSKETVSPYAYGIFGGSVLGAELKSSTLDRLVKWFTRR